MVNPDRNLYEPPYDDALLYDSDLEPERPRSRPLVVLLGIVVLAAFAGVVWVAYNQGVKQGMNGDPPLITADGPTRILAAGGVAPSGPAPGKDYGRWTSSESEAGAVNIGPKPEEPRAVPATEQATAATPQDAVGGQLGTKASDFDPPAPVDPRMDATTAFVGSGAIPALPGVAPQTEDLTPALPAEGASQPPAAGPRPLTPATAPIVKPSVPRQPTITQATPAVPKPLTATPAPKLIQPTPAETPPAETQIAAVEPQSAPAAQTPAPVGGVSIQLGSFPNDGLAASAWSKIKSANQALLGEYSPSIKPAQIPGKGTWYRLRVAGFADKSAAADVCEALKAEGQACIIAAK